MTVFINIVMVLCASIAVFSLDLHPSKVEECKSFLALNQGPRHLTSGKRDLLIDDTLNCDLTLRAYSKWPWSSKVPWSVFLNDVVPYYVMTEPRYFYRAEPFFMDYMEGLAGASQCGDTVCIVNIMNSKAWSIVDPPIIYMPSTTAGTNSYGIEQTMAQHNGSCTALSIFLVAALRSVGVASRIAGVPHWNRGSALCPNGDEDDQCGNHNWVEVYVPEVGWSFIDQPTAQPLNQSWFYPDSTKLQDHSTYNHSIYATSFARTSTLPRSYPMGQGVIPTKRFPMVWDWTSDLVNGWDVTLAYTHEPK